MSAHIITPKDSKDVNALSVERMRNSGLLTTVGPLQGTLMLSAHNGGGWLSIYTRRERCAAQRLVERGLLAETGLPTTPYVLTSDGRTMWLLVRGEQ